MDNRSHRLTLIRVILLAVSSMGFGSAMTILATKPPVVLSFLAKMLGHLFP